VPVGAPSEVIEKESAVKEPRHVGGLRSRAGQRQVNHYRCRCRRRRHPAVGFEHAAKTPRMQFSNGKDKDRPSVINRYWSDGGYFSTSKNKIRVFARLAMCASLRVLNARLPRLDCRKRCGTQNNKERHCRCTGHSSVRRAVADSFQKEARPKPSSVTAHQGISGNKTKSGASPGGHGRCDAA